MPYRERYLIEEDEIELKIDFVYNNKNKITNIQPKGKICIVIDDFGTDKNYEQYFDLHENLVFAVIPNTTYSNQISQQAEQRDIETIVHMPMETDSYPDSIYSDVILSSGNN